MQRKNYFLLIVAVLFNASIASEIYAQSETRRVEVGGQITTIHLRSLGEGPVGFGGRFSYNFTDNFAFDGEASHFPQDPDGNFGETQAVAGVKAGIRREKFGVFAKVRPGVLNFGGDVFKANNHGSRSNFTLDVGGVFEYYPSSRFIVRVDVGDTIIPFGDDGIRISGQANTTRLGTTHNLQSSIGFSVRF